MDNFNSADIFRLIDILPTHISDWVRTHPQTIVEQLVEIILDLGRPVILRFLDGTEVVSSTKVTEYDIKIIIEHRTMGSFGPDNRNGINSTLHRISCIRHRNGSIIGLTCRIGRVFTNNIILIEDLLDRGENILIVGKPGLGKTTLLRGACKYLSEVKRVVIVDTSNEIAGDSVVPHVSVGRSRRLMVPDGKRQADVMIEACENHYPEVIVVDEISTTAETVAARTMAERGVQLLATVHGNTIENICKNDAVAPLLGKVKSVTMGDEYYRKHGSKQRLEREYAPSFSIVVEIIDYSTIAIHHNVQQSIDLYLDGVELHPEVRRVVNGEVVTTRKEIYANKPK